MTTKRRQRLFFALDASGHAHAQVYPYTMAWRWVERNGRRWPVQRWYGTHRSRLGSKEQG